MASSSATRGTPKAHMTPSPSGAPCPTSFLSRNWFVEVTICDLKVAGGRRYGPYAFTEQDVATGAAGRRDPLRIYRTVFEWDPGKAARNLEKHGVTFFEAASVFTDPEGLDLPDDAHSHIESRAWRIGMSDEGRVLTVVYAL